MKKIIVVIIILLTSNINVYASTSSAYEYILMDADSGQILAGKNYNTPALIASITKIMTCILAIESGKIDETVTVTDVIKESYGSGIYIEVGEEILLRDLLYGLMLRSGNDAALMISKYVGGSVENFVKLMNNKAKNIGMSNTTFINPSGLDNTDSGNYSTAYDMAILTKYAMKNEEYRNIVKTKKHIVKTNKKTYVWHNKNKLLKEKYITGGKTGYTEKAKRTLVSTATSDNMNFIVVTIRDSDDWNTHKQLYQYAFDNYISYLILKKGKLNIPGENVYKTNFYIKDNIYISLKKDETINLISKIQLEKKDKFKNNEKIGEYQILKNKDLIKSVPIYIKSKKGEKIW